MRFLLEALVEERERVLEEIYYSSRFAFKLEVIVGWKMVISEKRGDDEEVEPRLRGMILEKRGARFDGREEIEEKVGKRKRQRGRRKDASISTAVQKFFGRKNVDAIFFFKFIMYPDILACV